MVAGLLAPRGPGGFAVKGCHLPIGTDPLDQEGSPGAQGWENLVVGAQAVAGTDAHRLLANAGVLQLGDASLRLQVAHPLVEATGQHHPAVHTDQIVIVDGHYYLPNETGVVRPAQAVPAP